MALTGRQERTLAAQNAWGSIFHAQHADIRPRSRAGGALTSLVASIEQATRLDDEAARIPAHATRFMTWSTTRQHWSLSDERFQQGACEMGRQHPQGFADRYCRGNSRRRAIWYAAADRAALGSATRHNVQPYIAAGVIAALSPGHNRWETNLANAGTAYLGGEDIFLSVRVATYTMRAKLTVMDYGARHAVTGASKPWPDILNSQKIRSSFTCIWAMKNECTIKGGHAQHRVQQRLGLSGSKFTIGKRGTPRFKLFAQVGSEIGCQLTRFRQSPGLHGDAHGIAGRY